MRTDTVLDLLMDSRRQDPQNFENIFKQKVLGITVLTSYNNKTHRIDDVDFNITPASTFLRKGVDTTIQEYYKEVRIPFEHTLSAVQLTHVMLIFSIVLFSNSNTKWK